MKLLTVEVRQRLPRLYSQEKTDDPIVHVKFFTPDSNWTWLVTEGEPDGDDFRVVFEVYHPNHMKDGELRVADPDGYCLLVGQIAE